MPSTTNDGLPPIRVAMVIDGLAPGGAEQLMATLARAAPAQGVELKVISLKHVEDSSIVDAIEAAGASVEFLDLRRLLDPRAVITLARRLRTLRPQVVHSHLAYSDILSGLASPMGTPHVCTLHVVQALGRHGRVKGVLAGAIRRVRSARIIAVSGAAGRWYRARNPVGGRQLVVIPNGVERPPEVRARADVRRELDIPADARVVTMVGVMRPGKGHDAAIRAFGALETRAPAVLLLAGDGPERESISRMVAASGADVRLLGHRADVADLLHASDVFVLPSEAEALPTVIIEAMSMGLPVVATSVGGIPELVEDEVTGLLVAVGDHPAIEDALSRLIDDRELADRLGAAGAARYERDLTADRWAQRLRGLYDEVARTR